MLAVEIVLIVIGTISICASFFIAKNKGVNDEEIKKGADLWTEKDEEVIIKHIDEILEERGMELVETTEDQMNRICNEKIMAIDEFSKPLLDKIHDNHEEVVFMYNMLGEKQKEIRQTMMDDTVERKVPNVDSASGKKAKPEKEPEKKDEEAKKHEKPKYEPKLEPVNMPAPEPKPEPKPKSKVYMASASETTSDNKEGNSRVQEVGESGLARASKKYKDYVAPEETSDTPEVSTGTPIKPDSAVGDTPATEVGSHRTVFTAQQYGTGNVVIPSGTPDKAEKYDDDTEDIPLPLSPGVSVQSVGQPVPVVATPTAAREKKPVPVNTEQTVAGKVAEAVQKTAAKPAKEAQTASPSAQLKRPSREFVMQHVDDVNQNGRGQGVEEQVRILYKQGKSVVDISKALNIGQGEVKLMIAMLKKRS